MTDLYSIIRDAVIRATGVSVNATLSTIDGSSHVLPPTYADAPRKHNMTEPDLQGIAAWVSIDSPASFANRIEDKLTRANLGLDPLRVAVAGQTLSTMQMPHHAYDAILRDSLLDGVLFRETAVGKEIIGASPANASPLLRYDPAVLLLGGWDSTSLVGNNGQERKWPAAVSVEIYATHARPILRAGGRIDPLGITLDAGRVIREGNSYRLVPEGEKAPAGAERPSEINHGNIAPTLSPKGVLVDEIKLSGALSLTRLRRYRFGGTTDQDVAARTALALMGIYGIKAVIENGLDLRRDCELVADQVTWSIRAAGGSNPLEIGMGDARRALKQALKDVELSEPILFTAGKNLEQLVARSR